MTSNSYCAGCIANGFLDACAGSFARIGIIKVHWECWSECNLPCSFCYRTKGTALSTDEAQKLIAAVKASGADTIVFAGGDPSIRPDICILFEYAKTQNLRVEIQTNAHHTPRQFLETLKNTDLVGLSLDGPDSFTHDQFRDKPGNFERVLKLAGFLENNGVRTIVRTVVSKRNYQNVVKIGELLERRQNIVRWSLLEFSAVGEGYINRQNYSVDRESFQKVAADVKSHFRGPAQVDVYGADAKVGTYALITPSGLVYGTGNPPLDGVFPVCGSILHEHLSAIAEKLPFSKENHFLRYGSTI